MNDKKLTICRKCKKKVGKYTTMFGYCEECREEMKKEEKT